MSRHILVITIDSLRADILSCYGGKEIVTPHLDSFAGAGVRFARHVTSLSTTLPSHCSLWTGCTPAVHGVPWKGVKTPRRRKTLAEIARTAGYKTAAITSWKGFQNQGVFGFEDAYSEHGAAAEENRGDHTLRRVKSWLEGVDRDRRHLLWVHFIDPHAPDNCPDPFPKTYAGEVLFTDQLVGELLSAWAAVFSLDDTLAVITADHGEQLHEHGVVRGHGTLWYSDVWAPLMMYAPGWIPADTVVNELVGQIDVLPTILDYCGLPMPYNVEGKSLRGLIECTDRDLRRVYQGQAIHDDVYTATIRNEEYAFHFGDGKNLAAIFDQRSDPYETRNLWEQGGTVRHSAEHSVRDAEDAT